MKFFIDFLLVPFQILDPNGEIVMLDTKDLTWNSNVKIFQDKTKVNWIRASHSKKINLSSKKRKKLLGSFVLPLNFISVSF